MNQYRDASDRLTFDFPDIESNQYKEITNFLTEYFNLVPIGELKEGLDEMFQDYKFNDSIIGLEWDNWSGYIVCARNKESESLATQIANFTHEKYTSNT